MITKVSLKNWRSHLETEMVFSEGTNIFVGNIGAGKTSILDAICFGLFGTFPNLKSKKIKLNDVIMKRPKEKNWSEVAVEFQIGENTFTVKRKIEKISGKTKVTAELRKNGKLLEAPQPTRVTEEVERILKTDYELFTRAVYSEQNNIDMFLNIPKGQRMKKIDQMLSIDKFEKARATVTSAINKLEGIIQEKKDVLSLLEVEKKKEELNSLREEIEKSLKQLKVLEKNSDELEINIKNLKEELKSLEEKKSLIDELTKEIDKLEFVKRSIENEIESSDIPEKEKILEKETVIQEEKENLENKLLKFEEIINHLKKDLSDVNAKIKFIESKMEEINSLEIEKNDIEKKISKLEEIEEKYKKLEKEYENVKNSINEKIIRISEYRNAISNLNSSKGRCVVCGSELSEEKKKAIKSEKETEIEKLTSEKSALLERLKTIEENKEKTKKELDSLRFLKSRLEDIKNVCLKKPYYEEELRKTKEIKTTKEEDLAKLEKDFENTRKLLLEVEKEITKLESIKEKMNNIMKRRTELENANKKIAELKEKLESLGKVDVSKIDNIRESLEEKIKEKAKFESEINYLKKIIEERKNSELKILEDIKNAEKIESEMKIKENVKKDLEALSAALVITQEELRKNFITAVNQTMMVLWPDLYPYKDFFSVRLAIKDGDYVLQLQDDTGWVPVEGIASGGERILASLALRIAFSLVLAPQLRWLVLDEPTQNLDSRTVEDLADVLREKINEFVEQVFIITHDKNLESAVTGYLYRIERERDKLGPSKIIKVHSPDEI